MKTCLCLVTLIILLISGSDSFAQRAARPGLSVFGRRVKGEPEAYRFDSKYIVVIERMTDGQITSIHLQRDKETRKTRLSPARQRFFFEKVNTVRNIGKLVYNETVFFRFPQDVYENAVVRTYFASAREGDDRFYSREIEVFLPYTIQGVISSVDEDLPSTIRIGDCEYYNFNEGVKEGEIGEFWVVGPRNGDPGNCFGLDFTNL